MRKLKLFFACLLMAVLSIGQVWGDNFSQTYTYSDKGDTWSLTNCTDQNSYWQCPTGTSVTTSVATIPGIFTDKTITSAVTITISNGTYGSGTDPDANTFKIYNSSACTSQVTATQTGSLPTSKTYVNTIYTVSQTNAANFSNDLAILITKPGKTIRLYTITVAFTYTAATPSFSITAQSNNNSLGTVSLSGTTITASPTTGNRVSTTTPYTVSPANSATITQNGNSFSVSAAANTTVTINFEAIPTHNIIFNNGVKVISNAVVAEGASYAITEAVEDALIASCTYKHFEGWTLSSSIADASVKPALVNSIDMEGADVNLYAVYSVTSGGGSNVSEETASVTISEYATAHSWGSSSSAGQNEIVINSDITASLSSGTNTGKYYNDGWRTYQTESATLTISAADGCELTSATFTYTVSNTGALKDGTTSLTSGTAYEISGSSKSFTVGNSGSATNGQVRFTAISVNYDKTTSGTTTYSLDAVCAAPGQCVAPTFNYGTGTYNVAQSIELATTTEEAYIYYTVDGSVPSKTNGTKYTAAFSVSENTTVKAIAVKDGNDDSDVAEAVFTFVPLTPTITKDVTHFLNTAQVTIACETAGVAIHYTTNGNEPTASSPTYTAPFNIDATTTVKAIAVKTNWDDSEIASETFTKATITSVADALNVIAGLNEGATTEEFYYVSGVIFGNPEIELTQYYNATYTIKDEDVDNSLTVFRGKYIDNVGFESVDQLLAGDEVLVYGQLQKYKSGNVITPEVKNSYIITLDRPVIPSLVVDPTIIDFGTVMQGATNIENQDITVYYENLEGSVDYVGEIAPFSASGTIAATGNKITISADVSEIGNYTKTLTVRSVDDGKSVDVTIKMNVTEPTGTFKLFSGELVEGEYVICSGTTAMKNVATSSPRIDAAEVDVDDVNKEIVNPDASVVWELKALTGDDAGYWTFYNKAVNKYAAFTGTDARGNIIAEVTDYAKFNHVSETAYEFQNKGKTGKNLRYNADYGFASYGTGTGVALTLYKKPASSVVTIENSTNGVVSVTDANQEAVNNGESIAEGATLTVAVEEKAGYRFTPKAYKTDDDTKTVAITEGVLTMPAYPITITTDELALYQIAIAVNEDAMGSASINGGADAIYVDGDDEIALVATANPGYEFVNWTVSDDDIVLDNANASTTTALAGASGTITANFQEQVCDNLEAPTLNGAVSTSYTTATIAWNAVEHADGYVLNITQGSTAVVTNELIVAPEVSYEATGLSDGKTYHFTIMAIGDGAAYCDENNELREGDFTTVEYPSVAVTYSENGHSVAGGSKKIMTPFALPEEVSHICTKEFVGWTTEDYKDYDAADKPAVFYNPGDNFTIESEAAITLYAVYAEVVPGSTTWDEITDVPTAGDYAICTSSYFLKAAISNERFANGDATPAISGSTLTTVPAEDCIWEISKNANNKFLIKNGEYYAAGTGVKNKGQLINDATDSKAQWTITYSEGFVVTNVYNDAQEVNATLKNNSNSGWACYAADYGTAPRFFKKNVTAGYTSNYSTSCVEPDPEIALTPNTEIAFGEVNQYDAVEGQDVAIKLINVASVTIAIEGDGASAFGIDKTALDANGTVTVTPVTTISGTYSATLIVRDDDANGADAQSIALSIHINAGEAPAWSAKWVVAQELYDGMPVLITGMNGSETYAMGTQGNNNRAAVLASVDANGALTPGEGTKQFTLEAIDAEHNKYAIKTSDGNYLYAASSGSNHLKTQDHIDGNATWTLSATSAVTNGNYTHNVMQFNSGSTLFACYASASQAGIKLYTPQTYTRTVSGNYGTICLPNGGILTNGALYEVAYYDNASQKIFFDEVLNGEMKAGMPYIFLPNEGVTELKVVYTDSKNKTQAASADEANGLVGNLGSTITLNAGDYFLYKNQYYVVSASESRIISVPQYYAYINMSYVPDYPTAPAPGRRRVSMNVNGEQVATGVESIQPSEVSIQKVLINGELFILRGEKMYDATGRLVK